MNNTKGKERRDNKSRRLCLLHKKDKEYLSKFAVVPHAGTWIEILLLQDYILQPSGRSPRGNVDWNYFLNLFFRELPSRSPRGNVDWNILNSFERSSDIVVPHAGTWIEIIVDSALSILDAVVPHAGTWIEIMAKRRKITDTRSFPTRERGLK